MWYAEMDCAVFYLEIQIHWLYLNDSLQFPIEREFRTKTSSACGLSVTLCWIPQQHRKSLKAKTLTATSQTFNHFSKSFRSFDGGATLPLDSHCFSVPFLCSVSP